MALSTAQYAALSSAAYSDFGGLVTDSYNPLVSTLKKDGVIFEYNNKNTGQMSARYAALDSLAN